MMFAGLTSAYMVKGSLPGWTSIELPKLFFVSTAVILASSVTLQMALKAFRDRQRSQYRNLMIVSLVLGLLFSVVQWLAFTQLYRSGIRIEGAGAGQFLFIIFGLHLLHLWGGMVALLVLYLKAISSRVRSYNPVPLELAVTYWHFVDLLWIYVLVFFMITM